MLNIDFSDFFDSDDDAFFLEASNCMQNDLPKNSEPKEDDASHSENKDTYAISSELKEQSLLLKSSNDSTINEPKLSVSQTYLRNSAKEMERTVSVSSNYNSSNIAHNLSQHLNTPDNASNNNNNSFTSAFSPKAKKRKCLEDAGLLEILSITNKESSISHLSNKTVTLDENFQGMVNSQFSCEQLLLSSWQSLQTVVSSHSQLLSSAKYYSIQRVLHESSKKRLPKHIVAPIISVLVKNMNSKDSSIKCTFMDETGEIKGKIDEEVLSVYKEFIVEGTALILRNVTFLCNVLILKAQNLVSLYLSDGTEKHLISLQKAFEESESLKSIHHEYFKPSKLNYTGSISQNCNSNTTPSSINNRNTVLIQNNLVQRKDAYVMLNSESDTSKNAASKSIAAMRSDAFVESLLSEDNGLDEFDQLLGNLDEKSFLEDM